MGMGPGGASADPSSVGGRFALPGGGDMSAAMSDPKFMESAMGMMRGMDEESLTAMMMSSGMCGSKEQAQTMAKQVNALPVIAGVNGVNDLPVTAWYHPSRDGPPSDLRRSHNSLPCYSLHRP